METAIVTAIELLVGAMIIPMGVWVTSSIFQLKQAVALIALDVKQNREIFELLRDRLK